MDKLPTNSYYFYRKARERYVHLLEGLTVLSASYTEASKRAFKKYQGAFEVCSPELVGSNPEVEQRINKLLEKHDKISDKGINLMFLVGGLIMTANPNNPYFGAKDYEAVIDYIERSTRSPRATVEQLLAKR